MIDNIHNNYNDIITTNQIDNENQTIWGTVNHIGNLFGRDGTAILKHKNDILKDEELDKTTCAKFAHVVGKEDPEWYNLDMIIAIGYRGILGNLKII